MQAFNNNSSGEVFDSLKLKPQWLSILRNIGLAESTATSFVENYCALTGESKSTVWYRLKKLKEMGLVDFAEKGDIPKPLKLTHQGQFVLRSSLAKQFYVAMTRA